MENLSSEYQKILKNLKAKNLKAYNRSLDAATLTNARSKANKESKASNNHKSQPTIILRFDKEIYAQIQSIHFYFLVICKNVYSNASFKIKKEDKRNYCLMFEVII